jgi:periplasmic protein TonB
MADLLRHLGALCIGLLGTLGVCGLSLGMNSQFKPVLTEPVAALQEMAAAPKAAQKTQRKRRSSASQKARKAAPSAAPLLAASLGGLDFGLDDGADLALAGATAALVGDLGAAVMDEAAVGAPPRPARQDPPSFPARARALGQAGSVTLSFVVDVDGSAVDVHVVESDPPGVFDQAAIDAAEGWEFEPGRHEGAPVAVRVRQTLRFALE